MTEKDKKIYDELLKGDKIIIAQKDINDLLKRRTEYIFKELEAGSCWFCEPSCHYMKQHYEEIKKKFLQERSK